MTKKGEKGLAMLLTTQHAHHLLFMKSHIMNRAMDDLSWMKKSDEVDKEDLRESELLTKEFIRLELVANTVHYAEVFAASLLAMKKYTRLHKFLLEYQPREIIDFYKQIPKKPISYVTKLLQYPAFHQMLPSPTKDELHLSIKEIHKEFKNLAKFYLVWHDMYNSYKHGLRIVVGKPNPYEDFTVLAYPFSVDKLDTMRMHRTDEEVEKCLRLCEFMWKILNNTESNFLQSILEKKGYSDFTTEIFHPSK